MRFNDLLKDLGKEMVFSMEDTIKEKGFNEAIYIGINNTVCCLLESSASDDKIRMLMKKYWDISAYETNKIIECCKLDILLDLLDDYLNNQGYKTQEKREIKKDKDIVNKIENNDNMYWRYRDSIEKLYKSF